MPPAILDRSKKYRSEIKARMHSEGRQELKGIVGLEVVLENQGLVVVVYLSDTDYYAHDRYGIFI